MLVMEETAEPGVHHRLSQGHRQLSHILQAEFVPWQQWEAMDGQYNAVYLSAIGADPSFNGT